MYQIIQDAQQSTLLGAHAQRVLASQARVAALSSELRMAVMDYEAAKSTYDSTVRVTSGSTAQPEVSDAG